MSERGEPEAPSGGNFRRDVASEQLKMFASARAAATKRKEIEASTSIDAHEPGIQSQNLDVDTSAQISAAESPVPETQAEKTQSVDVNADSSAQILNKSPPVPQTQAQGESKNINTETPAKHSDEAEMNSDRVNNDENARSIPSSVEEHIPLEESPSKYYALVHKEIEENSTTNFYRPKEELASAATSADIAMQTPVPKDPLSTPLELNFENTSKPIKDEGSFTSTEDIGLENLKRRRSSSFENEPFISRTSNGPSKKIKVEPEEVPLKKEETPNKHSSFVISSNDDRTDLSVFNNEDWRIANNEDDEDEENATVSDSADEDMKDNSEHEGVTLEGNASDVSKKVLEHQSPKKKNKGSIKGRKMPKTGREAQRARQIAEKAAKLAREQKSGTSHNTITKPAKRASQSAARRNTSGILKLVENANSLMEAGVEDSQEAMPIITASTKQSQLDRLLRNFPEDGNMAQARRDRADIDRASKGFGFSRCTAVDGMWLIKGMVTRIYNHQLIGANFMLERECYVDNGPRGGLLCDTMGLGKTVQVCTTIVANPPGPKVAKSKRLTLIVVPKSLLKQWQREIIKHCGEDAFSIYFYKHNAESTMPIRSLQRMDIVLTTYHELRKSCPYPSAKLEKELKKQDQESNREIRKARRKNKGSQIAAQDEETNGIEIWIDQNRQKGGHLHRTEWYRIVLDEAHEIKNHGTKASLAANALMGEHRWLVTGTPCMNRTEEFYPYFRFLKDERVTSFHKFQEDFCKTNDKRCWKKLDELLGPMMMHRTQKDKILGRPIVSLPKLHKDVLWIKQLPAEELFYRAIEDRLREVISAEYVKGDPKEALTCFVAQLNLFRRAAAHPLLIEPQIKLMFTIARLQKIAQDLRDLQAKRPGFDMTIYDQIQNWIQEKETEGDTAENFTFSDLGICSLCEEHVQKENNPKIIPKCKHVFCEECLETEIRRQKEEESGIPSCPECEKNFDEEKVESFEINIPEVVDKDRKRHGNIVKGKDYRGIRPKDMQTSQWLSRTDDGQLKLVQTVKMRFLKDYLKKYIADAPGDKIIIFSEWKEFSTVIGRILSDMEIGFIYFMGEMDDNQRDLAIEVFREKPEIQVMVGSLKCGGVGLNLEFANRIISLDLWWNNCIEKQALGRVYRIGQNKEVYFTRPLVKNTIDERMFKLQEAKKGLIDARMKNLSHEELMGMLGCVKRDKNGRLKIFQDYEDTVNTGPELLYEDEA